MAKYGLERINILCLSAFLAMFCHTIFCQDMLGTATAQQPTDLPIETPSKPSEPEASERNSDRDAEQLRLRLEAVRTQYNLPAMWAGKFRIGHGAELANGQGDFMASAGIRKQGTDTAVTDDDLIHLGSCTKAMTALLVAQLISDQKLAWQTTLGDVFDSVPELRDSPWATVTIEQLLWHESGAPANAPWSSIHDQHSEDAIAARREVLRWLLEQPRPKNPKHLYSNVGYSLLGHVCEQIEGQNWQLLLKERILDPIGTTQFGFGPVVGTQPLEQPWGHYDAEAQSPSVGTAIGKALAQMLGGQMHAPLSPIQLDNPPPLGPAGRAHMPMREWAKFVKLFARTEAPTELIKVDNASWQRLLTPSEKGNYAGGWILTERSWAKGQVLFHNGSNTTWYCVAWVAPKKNFCVLVATNGYSPVAATACDTIAAELVTAD